MDTNTTETRTPVITASQHIQPQVLYPAQTTQLEREIEQRIARARQETRNLYLQINKVKSKIQDATLFDMAKQVPSLNKLSINLKSTLVLKGHNNKIADLRWSADSKSILSASQDGFMLIWDSASGLKQNAIPLDSQWVLTCAISPRGNLVASAGLNNNCTVYGVSKENRIQQNIRTIFKGHTCYISDIEFIDSNSIVSASGDMTCALWDIAMAKRVREYTDHLGDVLGLAIPPENQNQGPGGNIFASCGSDGYVYIWDSRVPASVQHFFVSESDVSAIQFFKDGNAVAAGSDDSLISLFDLRADCCIASYSLASQLGEQRIETRTYTPQFMEYEIHTPQSAQISYKAVNSSYLDNQGVMSLDFSSSGRLMYACYTDLGCIVWDVLKAEVVGKLEGHNGRVTRVRVSPDGLGVCTGSWDTTMQVWSPTYGA